MITKMPCFCTSCTIEGVAAQTFKERVIKEGPWEERGDANMWMKMAFCVRKVALRSLG
uniref:Uncharacterized protein n=1 Tax=Aegilops tauschii subsp. strangulata TaxID=200361 RepID=A0A453RX25_AEGTS